jgi:hypothetical protein
VKNLDWELYASSRELFNGDYKDEGATSLTAVMAQPSTGKASGIQWLKRFAAGVKRRHTLVAGQAVLFTPFYTYWNYPPPGSPTD